MNKDWKIKWEWHTRMHLLLPQSIILGHQPGRKTVRLMKIILHYYSKPNWFPSNYEFIWFRPVMWISSIPIWILIGFFPMNFSLFLLLIFMDQQKILQKMANQFCYSNFNRFFNSIPFIFPIKPMISMNKFAIFLLEIRITSKILINFIIDLLKFDLILSLINTCVCACVSVWLSALNKYLFYFPIKIQFRLPMGVFVHLCVRVGVCVSVWNVIGTR